ncbi:MAG: hypothetical protein HY299_03410 [Verrucomicrobia bacterium]|nr:hypothetical protein [Verrucomicrobiota bacterium]
MAIAFLGSDLAAAPLATWSTDTCTLELDSKGAVVALSSRAHAHNYLATNQNAPLLSVRVDGALHPPDSAAWDSSASRLTLRYNRAGVTASIRVDAKPTHLVLELIDVQPPGRAALALWGPYPVTLRQTVGEVVGVARDDAFALGLQALNPKTLGGFPENDEGSADRPYAAQQTSWGSVLQAYSMDRSKPRSIAVWGKRAPNMPVPAIARETAVGSKIALFGCPASAALEIIGKIEVAEGLPHPMIEGVWAKVSPERGRSYLIADFSESDIDEMLGYVKRANLMSLYHGRPFKSWGHYEPSPKFFPNGVAGVKACATQARAMGIRLGAHTLSNFIQTEDPYITPVPDPRLARTGSSPLAQDIDAAATTVSVASPDYFAQRDRNELQTVVIDEELVRYRAVSTNAPFQLLDCQRGAFGTKASAHTRGTAAGKLMDHSYKVFFPNLDLQREIARNLARIFNETGLSHMDFDGHEGCLAPGEGTYGNEIFAKEFYDHLDHTVINGTSPPLSHFYWHINSYCNWGEPWYGGFRDSMQEYRINNQAFCERNFIPKMLGWYLLKPTTCLSDMEWMLARAAGFDAGFALATSPDALRKNPDAGVILDAIRGWEEARRAGVFPPHIREQLRDPRREFQLRRVGDAWDLSPFHASADFAHEQLARQPGEPTSTQWEVGNPDDQQELQFKLRVVGAGGSIANPFFEVNRSATFRAPIELQDGQTLLVEKEAIARIYDAKGNQVKSIPLAAKLPSLQAGANQIQFDCEFHGDAAPKVVVNFKTQGKPSRFRR